MNPGENRLVEKHTLHLKMIEAEMLFFWGHSPQARPRPPLGRGVPLPMSHSLTPPNPYFRICPFLERVPGSNNIEKSEH